MTLASLIESVLGADAPVGFRAYDGSTYGPPDAPATIILRSPDALRRIVTAPGELGFARAYVAGDLDLEGDVFAALDLRDRLPEVKLTPTQLISAVREVGVRNLRPLPPPREEARLRGRKHSVARDRAAVTHHYDVSNDFYRLVLGPSLTYSCAVFTDDDTSLEQAQANKYELVSRKLALQEDMRLLDVGCGWGGMVLHAAQHHHVHAVGVTISHRQVELASKRAAEAGLAGHIEIRNQDYRSIDDGPYDAISSIGMFEHVGESRLAEYFQRLYALLRPGGRLLNHGISRPPGEKAALSRGGFIYRYVFPDGELHEVGRVVSIMQEAGFEVRHVESLREHYAKTLRHWVANLEANWDEAVKLVGEARARIWRLYMAGSAVNFEANRTQIHQVLGVKPDGSSSGMPLRSVWEPLS
ncbi:MAG TPA: cyclopropane-fatty-acyl-phospholipid synthase family protein [Acidimicrobiales bacterium]|nr:cyclopropane-fatty-acyl-phospholipid synthase family protein [Acidimicrobiales bacterium]